MNAPPPSRFSFTGSWLGLLMLLLLTACTHHLNQSPSWPPPVKMPPTRPEQPQHTLRLSLEAAEAAVSQEGRLGWTGWLKVLEDCAILIEDRTHCGDGTLSRVRVTAIYQYALGRLLASLKGVTEDGQLQLRSAEGSWTFHLPAFTPLTPVRPHVRASTLRVGVPVRFGQQSATAVVTFDQLHTPTSPGVARLHFIKADELSAIRLHPRGPLVPIKRELK